MSIPARLNPMGTPRKIPLTFRAEQANSTVTLNAVGSPTVSGLMYRAHSTGSWQTYTAGTTITLADVGDTVQFWNSANALSSSSSNYVNFAMTGTVSAHGDALSLLDFSDTVPSSGLYRLFNGCTALVSAPRLSAKTLNNSSYYALFNGCTSLTAPPELPATILGAGCYYTMFYSCTSLETPPELPATSLKSQCYSRMFQNCTSLTYAPFLPAAALASDCYKQMFASCSSLSSVEVAFTAWADSVNATENWLLNVAADGTFKMPSALTEIRDASHIPSGWTIVNS